MDTTILYVVCAVLVFFAVMIAYRVVRYKGLSGFVFGAVPLRTIGQVVGVQDGPMGFVATTYLLNKQSGRAVGLELMMKSLYSIPRRAVISLRESQAELLVTQLQTAIRESRAV